MKSHTLLAIAALLLTSCGGGGGSSSSGNQNGNQNDTPDYGTVNLVGDTEVWSDQVNWTLTASADKLSSTGLAFTLTDGGSGLVIDAATGVIQGAATTPGVYELTISASDSSGGSTSNSFTFTSNAFIAGHWALEIPASNENLMLVVSRNGRVSLTNSTPAGAINALCNGQAQIVGDSFSADLACVQKSVTDASLSNDRLAVSGTVVEGSRITLTNFSEQGDGVFLFQPGTEVFNFGTIIPGIYVEYSDIASGISLVEVTADGSLTALAPSALGFQNMASRCALSGNLESDEIFADYERQALKEALQVFEATISLSDCDLGGGAIDSLDYNQTDALAHGASFIDTLADSLSFNLYSPGNAENNDTVNAGYFHYVHFCDESNQLTAVANFLADSEPFSIVACPVET